MNRFFFYLLTSLIFNNLSASNNFGNKGNDTEVALESLTVEIPQTKKRKNYPPSELSPRSPFFKKIKTGSTRNSDDTANNLFSTNFKEVKRRLSFSSDKSNDSVTEGENSNKKINPYYSCVYEIAKGAKNTAPGNVKHIPVADKSNFLNYPTITQNANGSGLFYTGNDFNEEYNAIQAQLNNANGILGAPISNNQGSLNDYMRQVNILEIQWMPKINTFPNTVINPVIAADKLDDAFWNARLIKKYITEAANIKKELSPSNNPVETSINNKSLDFSDVINFFAKKVCDTKGQKQDVTLLEKAKKDLSFKYFERSIAKAKSALAWIYEGSNITNNKTFFNLYLRQAASLYKNAGEEVSKNYDEFLSQMKKAWDIVGIDIKVPKSFKECNLHIRKAKSSYIKLRVGVKIFRSYEQALVDMDKKTRGNLVYIPLISNMSNFANYPVIVPNSYGNVMYPVNNNVLGLPPPPAAGGTPSQQIIPIPYVNSSIFPNITQNIDNLPNSSNMEKRVSNSEHGAPLNFPEQTTANLDEPDGGSESDVSSGSTEIISPSEWYDLVDLEDDKGTEDTLHTNAETTPSAQQEGLSDGKKLVSPPLIDKEKSPSPGEGAPLEEKKGGYFSSPNTNEKVNSPAGQEKLSDGKDLDPIPLNYQGESPDSSSSEGVSHKKDNGDYFFSPDSSSGSDTEIRKNSASSNGQLTRLAQKLPEELYEGAKTKSQTAQINTVPGNNNSGKVCQKEKSPLIETSAPSTTVLGEIGNSSNSLSGSIDQARATGKVDKFRQKTFHNMQVEDGKDNLNEEGHIFVGQKLKSTGLYEVVYQNVQSDEESVEGGNAGRYNFRKRKVSWVGEDSDSSFKEDLLNDRSSEGSKNVADEYLGWAPELKQKGQVAVTYEKMADSKGSRNEKPNDPVKKKPKHAGLYEIIYNDELGLRQRSDGGEELYGLDRRKEKRRKLGKNLSASDFLNKGVEQPNKTKQNNGSVKKRGKDYDCTYRSGGLPTYEREKVRRSCKKGHLPKNLVEKELCEKYDNVGKRIRKSKDNQ